MKTTERNRQAVTARRLLLIGLWLRLSVAGWAVARSSGSLLHISLTQEPLYRALKIVERHFQTTLLFVYDEVQPYRVTCQLEAADAEEAVGQLLEGKPFYFKSGRDFISISRYEDRIHEASIMGRVLDADHMPLPCASVEIYGDESDRRVAAAVADESGYFRIGNRSLPSVVLKVSCLGCRPYVVSMQNVVADVDLGHIQLKDTVWALNNVYIHGEPLLYKPDRLIITPTPEERAGTLNSMDLLGNLVLPGGGRLIGSAGQPERQTAQMDIRINGRKASYYELRALCSTDVVYVEYLYGTGGGGENRMSAINLVTKRHTNLGGGAEILGALPWADNRLALYGRQAGDAFDWQAAYRWHQVQRHRIRNEEEWTGTEPEPYGEQALTERGHRAREEHRLEGGVRWHGTERNEWDLHINAGLERDPGSGVSRQLWRDGADFRGIDRRECAGRAWDARLTAVYGRRFREKDRLDLQVSGWLTGADEKENYENYRCRLPAFRYALHRREQQWDGTFGADYERTGRYGTWRVGSAHSRRYAVLRQTYGPDTRDELRTAAYRLSAGYEYTGKHWQGRLEQTLHWLDLNAGHGRHTDWVWAPGGAVYYRPVEEVALHYGLTVVPLMPDVARTALCYRPLDARHGSMGDARLRPSADWKQQVGIEVNKQEYSLSLGVDYRYVRRPMASVTRLAEAAGEWVYRMENGRAATDFYPFAAVTFRPGIPWLQVAARYAWHRMDYRSRSCRRSLYDSRWTAELSGRMSDWSYGLIWGNAERTLLGDMEIRRAATQKLYVTRRLGDWRLGLEWLYPFGWEDEEYSEWRSGCGEQVRRVEAVLDTRNQVNLTLSWTWGSGGKSK